MLDPLPVKLAFWAAEITAEFSPSVTAVWLRVGRSCWLQLFNFVRGGEHLQGNPVDLSEQPEIGHSVRCKEDTAVLGLFTVFGCNILVSKTFNFLLWEAYSIGCCLEKYLILYL